MDKTMHDLLFKRVLTGRVVEADLDGCRLSYVGHPDPNYLLKGPFGGCQQLRQWLDCWTGRDEVGQWGQHVKQFHFVTGDKTILFVDVDWICYDCTIQDSTCSGMVQFMAEATDR